MKEPLSPIAGYSLDQSALHGIKLLTYNNIRAILSERRKANPDERATYYGANDRSTTKLLEYLNSPHPFAQSAGQAIADMARLNLQTHEHIFYKDGAFVLKNTQEES